MNTRGYNAPIYFKRGELHKLQPTGVHMEYFLHSSRVIPPLVHVVKNIMLRKFSANRREPLDNLRPRMKNQFEVQVTALQLSIYLTVQSFRNILLKLFSQPWSGQVVVGVVKVNT